jgi:hypothetical protein
VLRAVRAAYKFEAANQQRRPNKLEFGSAAIPFRTLRSTHNTTSQTNQNLSYFKPQGVSKNLATLSRFPPIRDHAFF